MRRRKISLLSVVFMSGTYINSPEVMMYIISGKLGKNLSNLPGIKSDNTFTDKKASFHRQPWFHASGIADSLWTFELPEQALIHDEPTH